MLIHKKEVSKCDKTMFDWLKMTDEPTIRHIDCKPSSVVRTGLSTFCLPYIGRLNFKRSSGGHGEFLRVHKKLI